jgi:hypothetical protein
MARMSGPRILARLYEIEEGLHKSVKTWYRLGNGANATLCAAKRDLIRSIIEEIEGREVWK